MTSKVFAGLLLLCFAVPGAGWAQLRAGTPEAKMYEQITAEANPDAKITLITAFEKQFPEFKPLPVSNPLKPDAPASPQVWLWPQDIGGNGMFIAAWAK